MEGLTSGSYASVPGINDNIIAAGIHAYRWANADAYRTIFYVSIAFTSIAVILSFFAPNVDDKMTGQVAVTLHSGGERRTLEEKIIDDTV
jgi:hypothetical protein